MLIKVFGNWINPNLIEYLKYEAESSIGHESTCIIFTQSYLRFVGRKPDELADEINKQIKESK